MRPAAADSASCAASLGSVAGEFGEKSSKRRSPGSAWEARPIDSAESLVVPDRFRERVLKPWEFPWSVHGQLRIDLGGRQYIGTGVLIDRKYVLTAGHNLYFRKYKMPAETVNLYFGLSGGQYMWESAASHWMVSPAYVNDNTPEEEAPNYDVGLVELDKPLGEEAGWFCLANPMGDRRLLNRILTVTGYPGDLDNGQSLYTMSGSVRELTQQRLFYMINTGGGQSGSAVYDDERSSGRDPYAVRGIHAYGGDPGRGNSGTRVTSSLRALLKRWVSELEELEEVSNGESNDDRGKII